VFAEGQAMRRISMSMNDWIQKLHGFLTLNDRNILTHAGKVSHQMAKDLAESHYDKFNLERIRLADKSESDFDKAVKQLPVMRKGKKKGSKK
jgi:hypothetical protein